MVVIRRSHPIAACGMGPLPAGPSCTWIPLGLSSQTRRWWLSFGCHLPSFQRNMQLFASGAGFFLFFSFSIDHEDRIPGMDSVGW